MGRLTASVSEGGFENEEDCKKALEQLNKHLESKNRISLSDFSRFMPIFDENRVDALSREEIDQISQDLCSTFDLTRRILILDKDIDNPNAKVVQVIPPLMATTKTAIDISDKAESAIVGLCNAITTPDSPVSFHIESAVVKVMNFAKLFNDDKTTKARMDEVNAILSNSGSKEKTLEDDLDWDS